MREGWEIKIWDDVLTIQSGRNQKEVLDENGDYPILGSAGKVMGYATDYLCPEGTTIIGRKGTIDSPKYIESKFWNVDTAFGLVSNSELDKRFLYYFCLSIDFTKLDKGTTLPSLVKKDLLKVKIPIPPLPEQQRIVEILDEAFEAIDQAKANVERNIQNAEELFQSKLNEVFSQRGEGWESDELINITNFIDYRGKTPKKTAEGIPLITAKNVRMGYLKKEPQEFIDPKNYDSWMTRGIPKKGDVLFTTEAPLANVALLNTAKKIALAQRIITLCPNREILDGEFLVYCLQSKLMQDQILEKGTGATVTGIKSRVLKKIKVAYPSLIEQHDIVAELNQIKEYYLGILKFYQNKIESLEELKKSILQKAFSGELTANEEVVA